MVGKFEEMVRETELVLNSKNMKEIKKEFLECSEKDLIKFHSTIGRTIRNYFKLWEQTWIPDIRNGFDYSPDHPDQISFEVMKQAWKNMNGLKE